MELLPKSNANNNGGTWFPTVNSTSMQFHVKQVHFNSVVQKSILLRFPRFDYNLMSQEPHFMECSQALPLATQI